MVHYQRNYTTDVLYTSMHVECSFAAIGVAAHTRWAVESMFDNY